MKAALGVAEADCLTLDHIPGAVAILQGQKTGPLSDPEVLDAGEIAAIRAATAQYNALIASKCAEKGAQLVDMHGFLNRLASDGAQAGNAHLTARFLGGIFSLDGIHPTSSGAAVTANEFVRAFNAAGASIPLVAWLSMRREGNTFVVSWPADAGQYVLQAANQAVGPWNRVTVASSTANGQVIARVPIGSGARLFRLAHDLASIRPLNRAANPQP
jgi:hypothetical protein